MQSLTQQHQQQQERGKRNGNNEVRLESPVGADDMNASEKTGISSGHSREYNRVNTAAGPGRTRYTNHCMSEAV